MIPWPTPSQPDPEPRKTRSGKKASLLAGLAAFGLLASCHDPLTRRAERGDPCAQYALGQRYAHGDGVPRDFRKAVEWYRRAALQGNAAAQYSLALNLDTQANPENREVWLRLAAAQGHAEAQVEMGRIHERGSEASTWQREAMKWYRKAAAQGRAEAQSSLGRMHQYGKGVPQNHREAMKWYRKAAAQGDELGYYYLGRMYDTGQGVPEDHEEAMQWYRKAAEQGHDQAQDALAGGYIEGKGVPRDYVRAYAWLCQPTVVTNLLRRSRMQYLESKMTPDQLSQAQTLAGELQQRIEAANNP